MVVGQRRSGAWLMLLLEPVLINDGKSPSKWVESVTSRAKVKKILESHC